MEAMTVNNVALASIDGIVILPDIVADSSEPIGSTQRSL
jgi:hypothetical protein